MIASRISIARVLALLLTTLTACGGGSSGTDTGFQEVFDLGATRYVGEIPPETRRDDGRWIRYEWAEDSEARCMNGGRYHTDIRPADSDNLLIFLWGVGACLPNGLCLTNESTLPAGNAFDLFAFMDVEVEGVPLSSWNLAMVSYCDGSLMAGNVDLDRDGDGTVDRYHRGIRNLSAGVDVTVAEMPNPERIVLAGISGGAYSTIASTFLVRNGWPEVPIDIINDAGVGLGRGGEPAWIEGLLRDWDIDSLIPPSCTDCTADGHLTSLLDWQLDRDPNLRIAALSSYEDFIIGDLFINIPGERFRPAVTTELRDLAEAHPGRYERFLYEGAGHTLIAIGLDKQTAGGVVARDWLGDMLNRRPWTSAVDPE